MFNLIPISILVMAFGGVLYIISNHLSEFEEDNDKNYSGFGIRIKLINWINQLPLDAVKSQSFSITQKFLHRTRLLLLKADNGLMKIIKKLAEKEQNNGNGKEQPIPNFWEDLSNQKKEEIPIAEPELKIELASKKDEAIEKFFDPVRSQTPKVSADTLAYRTSNGVDIKPKKLSKNKNNSK